MINQHEENDASHNPIDNVETVLSLQNWIYERTASEELVVDVAGQYCSYRIIFLWQEHMKSLHLYCQYDIAMQNGVPDCLYEALEKMNREMWLGHFEMTPDCKPCFRHTSLIYGFRAGLGCDYVQDLIDISLAQCERFYNVFHLLSHNKYIESETLSLAMMDAAGES